MSYRFKDYNLQDVNGSISKIRYGVLSEEEILNMSVENITEMNSFQSGDIPVKNGLFDKQLGTVDKKNVCPTCNQKELCPGHPGRIELEFPVFLYQFFVMARQILTCICPFCSKAYINPNQNQSNVNRLIAQSFQNKKETGLLKIQKLVYEINKGVQIKYCGEYNHQSTNCNQPKPIKVTQVINGNQKSISQLKIQFKQEVSFNKNKPEERKTEWLLNAYHVRQIFEKMTDQDIGYIGLNPNSTRPKDLIATVFLVQSPHIRPAIKSDNGSRSQDDLTSKLIDIIRANQGVHDWINNASQGGGQRQFDNIYKENYSNELPLPIQHLQLQIATIINNNIPQHTKSIRKSGKQIKSVEDRLDQKRGRVRDNLMGKRVDFSARSVITPGATLKINQLGVPIKVAMTLATPREVNRYNIERYREMIKKEQYPGITSYSQQGKNYIKLDGNPNRGNINLQYGDIVYKHLENGEWVLFNRQPSLHKPSIMAHQIIIVQDNSFHLPVNSVTAYNADFDGDEMNLHAPISAMTETEIQLSNVNYQIIAQKDSKPIISLVQDPGLGIFYLSKKEQKYNQIQAQNLIALNKEGELKLPEKVQDENMYSGRDILSNVIPKTVNLKKKIDQKLSKNEDKQIIIEDGKIKSGTFTKSVYGSMTNSLIHQTNNYSGPNKAAELINNTTNLAHQALLYEGFSLGMRDVVICEEAQKKIQQAKQLKKEYVQDILRQVQEGKFQIKSTKTPQEFLEFTIFKILNNNETIEKILTEYIDTDSNNMAVMISTETKGKIINLMQILAELSQQEIEGKRASTGFTGRALPHFKKYDYGPEARGYVQNSFSTGLNPTEYFFHSCAGRVGLCDTAVKTAQTGYIQRKLAKAQENLKTDYDYSVTNSRGAIIQFQYFNNCFSSDALESHTLKYVEMSIEKLKEKYLIDKEYLNKQKIKCSNIEVKRLKEYYDQIKNDSEYVGQYINMRGQILYAVNFEYLIFKQRPRGKIQKKVSPIYVLDKTQDFLLQFMDGKMASRNFLFPIILRYYLNPKDFCQNYNTESFDNLLKDIMMYFYKSLCTPKENVGIIGAQSLGETSSQLVLNSFHLSGSTSGSEITRGLPRIIEILSLQDNIKSPLCYIYLKEEGNTTQEKSRNYHKLKNQVELIHLKDILLQTRIEHNPYPQNYFNLTYNIPGFNVEPNTTYILILQFDRDQMGLYDIKMVDVKQTIKDQCTDDIYIFSNDDNDDLLHLQIKINSLKDEDDHLNRLKSIQEKIVEDLILRGVDKITKAVATTLPSKDSLFYDKEQRRIVSKEIFRVQTQGSNIIGLLQNQDIDHKRLYSNNIIEAKKVYGIEFAKNLFIDELFDAFSQAGNVSIGHIELLACWVFHTGDPAPVNRYGISSQFDTGVLHKASFEETPKNLINGALYGESENLQGTTAPIIIGQAPNQYGTSSTSLYYDIEKLLDIKN